MTADHGATGVSPASTEGTRRNGPQYVIEITTYGSLDEATEVFGVVQAAFERAAERDQGWNLDARIRPAQHPTNTPGND